MFDIVYAMYNCKLFVFVTYQIKEDFVYITKEKCESVKKNTCIELKERIKQNNV